MQPSHFQSLLALPAQKRSALSEEITSVSTRELLNNKSREHCQHNGLLLQNRSLTIKIQILMEKYKWLVGVTMWWLPLLNWILTDDSVLHTLHVNISHREKLILKTLVILRYADIYNVNNIHDQHNMSGPRRCHIFLGWRMNTWHFTAGSPPRFFMFLRH